jgi:hypothetical protein
VLAAGNVVYEVDLEVDADIAPGFRDWLRAHVRELLALPGFLDARVLEVREPAPGGGRVGLCVQYRLRDDAALQAYLRDHAPRMRAAGIERYGDRFTARRRILDAARPVDARRED